MKRVRLNKLINSPLFVIGTSHVQHGSCFFSHQLHSLLLTNISESIGDTITGADVIDIEEFTTIQLPK